MILGSSVTSEKSKISRTTVQLIASPARRRLRLRAVLSVLCSGLKVRGQEGGEGPGGGKEAEGGEESKQGSGRGEGGKAQQAPRGFPGFLLAT